MKAKVFDLDGKVKEEITLPIVFDTEHKPKLIQRAVLGMQSAKKQPKGADPTAGMRNTAEYVGTRDQPTARRTINVEHARLPRLKNRKFLLYGRVARVAQSVGGRSPTSPVAWKITVEKVNKKERKLALNSAIAATANKDLVGRRFVVDGALPIVVVDDFEKSKKTKEVLSILSKIGAGKDLENALGKRRKRAGKGNARGRTVKQKKSVLIITGENSPVLKAARNLPGVDAVTVSSLNVELLAPGAEAGRLSIWTTSALEHLKNNKKAHHGKDILAKRHKTSADLRSVKKEIIIKKKAARKALEAEKKAKRLANKSVEE